MDKPSAMAHQEIYVEWINLVFGPVFKKYLEVNDFSLQVFLVFDNTTCHLPNLEDDIFEKFIFIKILYLPPNTTPIVQSIIQ